MNRGPRLQRRSQKFVFGEL